MSGHMNLLVFDAYALLWFLSLLAALFDYKRISPFYFALVVIVAGCMSNRKIMQSMILTPYALHWSLLYRVECE